MVSGMGWDGFWKSKKDEIIGMLGALDDKIDLNRRMNETLEAMARAIFKDWFMDFGPVRSGPRPKAKSPTSPRNFWTSFPTLVDDDDKPMGWALHHSSRVCCAQSGILVEEYRPRGNRIR